MEVIKEKGVKEVKATEVKNVNKRRSVTLEYCFRGEKTENNQKKENAKMDSFFP